MIQFVAIYFLDWNDCIWLVRRKDAFGRQSLQGFNRPRTVRFRFGMAVVPTAFLQKIILDQVHNFHRGPIHSGFTPTPETVGQLSPICGVRWA